MIRKLMLRDFRVYRNQMFIWSLFGLVFGMILIFVNTHQLRMFAGSSNLISIAVIWPFIAELRNKNTWIHTASLPITRSSIITSRYLMSLVIGIINLIVWLIVFNVLQEIITPDSSYVVGVKAAVYVLLDLMFHLGLFYFAFYRFNLIVTIAFYFLPLILPNLLRAFFTSERIPMSDFVIADFTLFSVAAIAAIVLFILSFVSSWFHFQKRDI